jgi:SAM-dependent methyltransferase
LDLTAYRLTETERKRTDDLRRLIPSSGKTALDIGARDGHFSRIIRERFSHVIALDLVEPQFSFPGVSHVTADATALPFADGSFDFVFCAEVLEHVPRLDLAARNIARVARGHILIGVPYRQDLRVGRTRCLRCGRISPPWGHVNSFDEAKLGELFSDFSIREKSYVGETKARTTAVAAWLMDRAGNPWGTYDQEEPCVHCGGKLSAPAARRTLPQRCCSAAAVRLNRLQAGFSSPLPNWIHVLFAKA